jgi:hypothetical protein
MMKAFKLALAAAAVALVGCSGTLPVQSGGVIEKNSGTKVTATVSQINFLGFSPMDLNTAGNAIAELQHKCNGGKVTGVTSLVRRTFLFIVVKEEFEASGYCAD